MARTRRQLLREARQWRLETAAFNIQMRPLDQSYRVWHRRGCAIIPGSWRCGMDPVCLVMPILPGKTDDARAFLRELEGFAPPAL